MSVPAIAAISVHSRAAGSAPVSIPAIHGHASIPVVITSGIAGAEALTVAFAVAVIPVIAAIGIPEFLFILIIEALASALVLFAFLDTFAVALVICDSARVVIRGALIVGIAHGGLSRIAPGDRLRLSGNRNCERTGRNERRDKISKLGTSHDRFLRWDFRRQETGRFSWPENLGKDALFVPFVAGRGHSLRPDDDMAAVWSFVFSDERRSVTLEIVH